MVEANYVIRKGSAEDLQELARLYDELNDALEKGTNYPGWKKNLYPTKETAQEGIEAETLFILQIGENIAGTVILNHDQPKQYERLKWLTQAEDKALLVVHTLAVHPHYFNRGIGKELLYFAEKHGADHGIKAIRLDVSVHNLPAIRLYERCGYTLVGEVDLELNIPGLELFKCYEKVIP